MPTGNITDHYSDAYDNHIIKRDFNLEPSHPILSGFKDSHNYFHLIKGNTYFKGQGTCIDLISTKGNIVLKIKCP